MATGSGGGHAHSRARACPGRMPPSTPTPSTGGYNLCVHPLVHAPRHTCLRLRSRLTPSTAHTACLHTRPLPGPQERRRPLTHNPGVNTEKRLHSPSNGWHSAPNPGAEVSGTPAEIHTHPGAQTRILRIHFPILTLSHMLLHTRSSLYTHAFTCSAMRAYTHSFSLRPACHTASPAAPLLPSQ